MDIFIAALLLLADPYVIFLIIVASLFGLFVGAIPGPDRRDGDRAARAGRPSSCRRCRRLPMMVTCSAMAIFAGDIPGALLRIPGTPASAAYADEAYAMTRKGQGQLALGAGVVFSAIGGILGTIVLVTAGADARRGRASSSARSNISGWSASASPAASSSRRDRRPRPRSSLLIGLLAGDRSAWRIRRPIRASRSARSTSRRGIDFIPAMIGMFAIAEILRFASQSNIHLPPVYVPGGAIFGGQWALIKQYPVQIAARLGGRHADRRAARRRLRYRGLDQLRHRASASPRSRRNSAPAMSRASSRAARPTTPRSAAPGFRRWSSAFPATPSPRS